MGTLRVILNFSWMVNPLEIESYWILRVSKYINGIFLLTLKHCWILDIHLVVSSSIEYININKTGIYHSLWKAHKMNSRFCVSDWAILQEGLYSKCFFLKAHKEKPDIVRCCMPGMLALRRMRRVSMSSRPGCGRWESISTIEMRKLGQSWK